MQNKNKVSPSGRLTRGRSARALAAAVIGLALASTVSVAQPSRQAFEAVPEGQAPQGILAGTRSARAHTLATHPQGAAAVGALRAFASQHWGDIGALDVVGLSRFHVEATRGWQAPTAPTFNGAELLAADEDAVYLMLRGPRLPASFKIVHRHLVLYARFDVASGELSHVSVSIHGEVHE